MKKVGSRDRHTGGVWHGLTNSASACIEGNMAPLVNLSTEFRRRSGKVARVRPSTNLAPAGAPEVYFRILHVTPEHGK